MTDSAPTSPSCPSPRPIPGFTSKPQTPPHHGSGHGVYQTFVGQHRGHGATLYTQTPQSVSVHERTVSSPTSHKSRPPPPDDYFRVTDRPHSLGRTAAEVSVKYPGTPLNADWSGSTTGRANAKLTRKDLCSEHRLRRSLVLQSVCLHTKLVSHVHETGGHKSP